MGSHTNSLKFSCRSAILIRMSFPSIHGNSYHTKSEARGRRYRAYWRMRLHLTGPFKSILCSHAQKSLRLIAVTAKGTPSLDAEAIRPIPVRNQWRWFDGNRKSLRINARNCTMGDQQIGYCNWINAQSAIESAHSDLLFRSLPDFKKTSLTREESSNVRNIQCHSAEKSGDGTINWFPFILLW
jgi:hypothetical protein